MTEGFLSRWSRSKQAAAEPIEPAKVPPDEGASQNAADASRDSAAPVFDPASLPALESITADTDIRAFFAAGVPAELTRAALHQAWTSDPKIRDFVGLADYDWDFNQPGSMADLDPLQKPTRYALRCLAQLGPDNTDDGAPDVRSRPRRQARGAPVRRLRCERPDQPTQTHHRG